MAWTYGDYADETLYPTAAAQLARLGKFIGEVSGAIQANVARDGASRDSSSLNQLLDTLMRERVRLKAEAGSTGSVARVRMG